MNFCMKFFFGKKELGLPEAILDVKNAICQDLIEL